MALKSPTTLAETYSRKEETKLAEKEKADISFKVHIDGTDGADILFGNPGDNYLYGGGDNDILMGDEGADELHGSNGKDTADYTYSTSAVRVDLKTGFGKGGYAQGDRYVSIENAVGSKYDDELIGNGEGNVLDGGRGDDELFGGGGDDTLNGGIGEDVLEGGAGADRLDGGSDSDTASYASSREGVTVNLGRSVQMPGTTEREETIKSGAQGGDADGDQLISIENLIGSGKGDILFGDEKANRLEGRDGDDFLYGQGGGDTLDGGGDNDWLYSGDGADVLIGGEGFDTASYDFATEAIYVNLEQGWGLGGAQGDTLEGIEAVKATRFDDELVGSSEANRLMGEGGNDILKGGAGADELIGGGGEDWTDYSGSVEAVTVSLASGTGSGGDAEGDTLNSIENIDGNDAADFNTYYGDDRNNVIVSKADHDQIFANDGQDTIRLTQSHALVEAGDGEDTVEIFAETGDGTAHLGHNAIDGGEGTDTIEYDYFGGGIEIDLFAGTATYDNGNVDWISGFENIVGTYGADEIYGDDGDNVIDVRGGYDDVAMGRGGNDWFIASGGEDTIDGGEGVDTIDFSAFQERIVVGLDWDGSGSNYEGITDYVGEAQLNDGSRQTLIDVENVIGTDHNDILFGDGEGNTLTGGEGDDTLSAEDWGRDYDSLSGVDVLDGGAGEDVLHGGYGDVIMTGGADRDEFFFFSEPEAGSNAVVTDFDASTELLGFSRFEWINSVEDLLTGFVQSGDDAVFTYGSSTIILENVDVGDLSADNFFIG